MAISRNQVLIGGGVVGVLAILYFLSREKTGGMKPPKTDNGVDESDDSIPKGTGGVKPPKTGGLILPNTGGVKPAGTDGVRPAPTQGSYEDVFEAHRNRGGFDIQIPVNSPSFSLFAGELDTLSVH